MGNEAAGGTGTSAGHSMLISVDAEAIRVPRPGGGRRELPSRGIRVRKTSVKQQAEGLCTTGDSEGFMDMAPTWDTQDSGSVHGVAQNIFTVDHRHS